MSDLQILGRTALAIRPLARGIAANSCLLPAPRPGEVCSLPAGHTGDHEVQVLAFVTIDRFTSNTENPMTPTDDQKRDAAATRAEHEDIAAKPARPRSAPTPREARPQRKPDER